ncbi:MAG: hypothetical protein LBB12_00415 [Holosporaceae bacterium]|nr:hypothetical protein [Holosporaceae bacterium]
MNLTSNYYSVPTVVLFIPAFAVFLSNSKKQIFYVVIVAVAVCAWSSANYSKNLVTSIWEHRKNDHLFFEYLVNEYKSGKKLFWLSDNWLEANDPVYKHFDGTMCWNRYQHFIDYYSRFTCKLERVFDFDKFDKNSLILCGSRTVQSDRFSKTYDELMKLGFKKIMEFSGSSGAVVFAYD